MSFSCLRGDKVSLRKKGRGRKATLCILYSVKYSIISQLFYNFAKLFICQRLNLFYRLFKQINKNYIM